MKASRRTFLAQSTLAVAAAGVTADIARAVGQSAANRQIVDPTLIDLHRPPDSVSVAIVDREVPLAMAGETWRRDDVSVTLRPTDGATRVTLAAPASAIKHIRLRWRGATAETSRIFGDAWERGYGDLEWRGIVPDRAMPWYVAVDTGAATHTYGVRTGPRAFCYWQLDANGITLVADVRSGAAGVVLKDRVLDVCDIVTRMGHAGETSFQAIHAFCRQMCANPRLPSAPVYGSNDWYWAYGKNSARSVIADAEHVVELSPTGANRPFAVIDDGWQPQRGADKAGVGLWNRGNEKFPDMPRLAADIKRAGARPGIWIRPLLATTDTADSWRLPRDRQFLDPTIPEVREKIAADFARLHAWGFDLIKHDYSTFDLFGRWGFQMGTAMTRDGWTFASGPTETTAEVITRLYTTIREASGDSLIIGCNTVSHLSAGYFEMNRVGDDTSGNDWSRTRKMGVNTLAFRGVQHGAFYVADADCVGVTTDLPWSLNRQWLDLLAQSGTMLFVSLAPDALGADQRRDLRAALATAAVPQPLGEPLDWQRVIYPSRWRLMDRERTFDWVGPEG